MARHLPARSEELKRELVVNSVMLGGLTLLVLVGLMLTLATRGRILMPPFGFFALFAGVGAVVGYGTLLSEHQAIRRTLSHRREQEALPPPPLPEEEKLASLRKLVVALPEHAAPEHVALLRLAEESGEQLVALIGKHRAQGTEDALEPQAAMRELTRLEREAREGVLQESKENPSDAVARAAQISFKPEQA